MKFEKRPFLEVSGIKKKFGHVEALRGVDVSAYEGEILAIVGDNGAGKSTLIKILSGVIKPDEGEIKINGKIYDTLTPQKAISVGISTVYQDLALGNTMDVAANIFLGNEICSFGFIKKKKMNAVARELLKNLEIQIPDVTIPVGNLSGGQRQGVAVARLIYRGGKIFIFDEPTAAMGINESNAVLKLLKKLAAEKYIVIIISHNLPQVFQISDRICVMHHGNVMKQLQTKYTSMDEVVALITGVISAE